jgi:hypothetical protein
VRLDTGVEIGLESARLAPRNPLSLANENSYQSSQVAAVSPERRLKQLPFRLISVRPFVGLRQRYVQCSIDELGGSSMTRLGRSPGKTIICLQGQFALLNQFPAIAPNVVV